MLGVQPKQSRQLLLYPSPATTSIRVPALLPGTQTELVDRLGRVVRTMPVSTSGEVSVRDLAPGLYILRATNGQGVPYSGRVLVE
ncbi:T9SS type A sorting domain-containing protein [Hymenobacter cellulosivorans]|uniref:T9SS type A sorting domain-containing protein n=1 Tax=Hymenobacter cellulosivorans TaxID=2932249 RepID=UPI0035CC753B